MMVMKFSCQLSTSSVLGSFGRRGLVHLTLFLGEPSSLEESENQTFWSSLSPSAMLIVAASLLQTFKGEGDHEHALEVWHD